MPRRFQAVTGRVPAGFDDTVSTETKQPEMSVTVAVSGTSEIVGTIGCAIVGRDEGHIRGTASRSRGACRALWRDRSDVVLFGLAVLGRTFVVVANTGLALFPGLTRPASSAVTPGLACSSLRASCLSRGPHAPFTPDLPDLPEPLSAQ